MAEAPTVEPTGPAEDIALPFRLEGLPVRGRLIRLGASIDTILGAHDYPEPVSQIVGQTLVLAAMLGPALKFKGVFTVQLQAEGPLSLVVADFNAPDALRAYASFDRAKIEALRGGCDLAKLMGKGSLAFTLDPQLERERYQSVVPLEGSSLAACARHYFTQSEQLPTSLSLAVARHFAQGTSGGRWRAGGLLLQYVPESGGHSGTPAEEDAWRYAEAVSETLGLDELVDPTLTPNRLLLRLFHEAGVRVFAAQSLRGACRCSEERIARVLAAYGSSELSDLVEADGMIVARCEFCSRVYRLSPESLSIGRQA